MGSSVLSLSLMILALCCVLGRADFTCFTTTNAGSCSGFDTTSDKEHVDTILFKDDDASAKVARCNLVGYQTPKDIKDQPTDVKSLFEVVDKHNPYFGKCCWVGTFNRYYCQSVKPPSAKAKFKSQINWVDSWVPIRLSGNAGYKQSKKLPTFSSTLTITKKTDELQDDMVNALLPLTQAGVIRADASMTEMPDSDHLNVFKQRLYQIQSTAKHDEVKHQAFLLHTLLEKATAFGVLSLELLTHINACIGTLDFAEKTRQHIDDGKALFPSVSSVGDHFFAESFLGHGVNDFNAYAYSPYQAIGHSDPHAAVHWLQQNGKKIGQDILDDEKDPLTNTKLTQDLHEIQVLLVKTLTLDMSSWARLADPKMQVNPLTTGQVKDVYGHVMKLIDDKAADKDEFAKWFK